MLSTPTRPRLPPVGSPFTPKLRSPAKARAEPALTLRRAIGTTSCAPPAFAVGDGNSFAYAAGSAAVVATIAADGSVSQRFFRAKSDPADRRADDKAGRDRVKAVSCVAVSPGGRMVAVGETGHKPRVVVFSADGDVIAAMAEHTFGVKAVAFSDDGRFLASLGVANDGFLYVWSVGRSGATVWARNRCTASIRSLAWAGSALVTVGTRHVKVWRAEEAALSGRNCVLGPLLDATVTGVAAVGRGVAVVVTDRGDVGLVDDRGGLHALTLVGSTFPIVAVTVHDDSVYIFGRGQMMKVPVSAVLAGSLGGAVPEQIEVDVAAAAFVDDWLVMADEGRSVWIQPAAGLPESAPTRLPGHAGAVDGVGAFADPTSARAAFFTWAADRILAWDSAGRFCWEIVPGGTVRVAEEVPGVGIAVGDGDGGIQIVDFDGAVVLSARAHAAAVTGLAAAGGVWPVLASASRDRTVQVFGFDPGPGWRLIQTADEHVGAVSAVRLGPGGRRLVSASADRTVVVRDLVTRSDGPTEIRAFVVSRTLSFRATPAAIAVTATEIVTSTVDRCVYRHDAVTGALLAVFKAGDPDGGDPVILSGLTAGIFPGVAGVSSSDKSVRLYSDTGVLTAREWGHTEGVSGIAAVPTSAGTLLVSASVDGVVFLWQVGDDQSSGGQKSPLRRVMSASELARFGRVRDSGRDSGRDGRESSGRESKDSSPTKRAPVLRGRKSCADLRPGSPARDLAAAADQTVRLLRAFRRRLAAADSVAADALAELERELGLTARLVGERTKSRGLDEAAMVRLLDEHGERLVEMLGSRLRG